MNICVPPNLTLSKLKIKKKCFASPVSIRIYSLFKEPDPCVYQFTEQRKRISSVSNPKSMNSDPGLTYFLSDPHTLDPDTDAAPNLNLYRNKVKKYQIKSK